MFPNSCAIATAKAMTKPRPPGETRYGNDLLRVPSLHKQGHALSIAFTVAMLLAPDGKLASIVAIVPDETKRWADERDLRRHIAALEAGSAKSF